MILAASLALAITLPAASDFSASPVLTNVSVTQVTPSPSPTGSASSTPTPSPSAPALTKTSVSSTDLFNGSKTAYTFGAYDNSTKYFKVAATGTHHSNVVLQQLVSGKWVNKMSIGAKSSSYTAYLDLNGPLSKNTLGLKANPGTSGTYRLMIPATKTTAASYSPQRTITWAKAAAHNTSVQPFGKGAKITAKTTSNHIYSTVAFPESVTRAYLEKKVGSKWVTERTITPTTAKGKRTATFWVYLPKPGSTDTYRLKMGKTTTHNEKVTAAQQLHLPKRATKITTWSNPNHKIASNRQGKLHGWATGGVRPVQLQKWNGKSWVKVVSGKTAKDGVYNLLTPKTNSTTTIKYRVHFPATGTDVAATTKAVALKHENPRHYTGYKKTIYNHVKKWCPNIVIESAKPNKKWDGLAHMGKSTISVVTGKSGNRLKHIALHECAHMLQDWAYKGDYKAMDARMNKIYGVKGSKGIEHNADCVARKLGSPGPYSYNSNCKGARGTAAATIIKGKRP